MFYDNLRKICKAKNTTPTAILKELGMSTGNTGKWKNGGVPSADVVYKIAKLLNVSVEFLLAGEEKHANNECIDPEDQARREMVDELERLITCYQVASRDDKNVVWAALNKYIPTLNM